MKYAFIFGSNAFVVPSGIICYTDNEDEKEFLRINSIYHDFPPPAEDTHLDIDLNINDIDGTPVFMLGNLTLDTAPYTVEKKRNCVDVFRPDGSLIIHVHQLDDVTAMSLERNITAELDINAPIAVIRVKGDFMAGGFRITADGEKLFINHHIFANSVQAGKNQLKFTPAGVQL